MQIPIPKFLAAAVLFGAASMAAPVSAAVKLDNSFDGDYYNPQTSGRGILMDVTKLADGSSNLFVAQFTFDAEGNPVWIGYSGELGEHQFEGALDVYRMDGGNFGFPFQAPSQTVIGSATIQFASCNSVRLDVDMNDGSGFSDAEFDLQPVAGANTQCVYQREFSGCPDFASAVDGLERACALNGVYNEDIVLTNETTWVLDGLVRVGNDNAQSSTLRIEPGTVLVGGSSGTPYLYISPGSKIIANGTPWAPIVLTSALDGFGGDGSPSPGDLGGLVVSGNAPANACPEAPYNCFSEFDQTQRFGGNEPHDSSGEISYFQIRYAGIEFQPDSEVNSFTFQAVGDNTTVHHIQAYRGADDGIEFFGGTVNVNNVVVTQGGDDAIDWDLGYSGYLQYGLVVHGSGFGEDYAIEGASNGDNFDAMPRATPIVANYSFIGNGNGSSGILLKEGSGGQIWNSVVTSFPEACISMEDAATYTAAGSPTSPSGSTGFSGIVIDCGNPYLSADGAAYTVQAFVDAFPGNTVGNAQLSGYIPSVGSPARSGGLSISNPYFDFTGYRGAFSGDGDWTRGWTYRPGGAN